MRVAWLAPYPVQLLEPDLKIARRRTGFHPCSWIVNLSNCIAQREDIELHIVTESPLIPYDQVVRRNNVIFHVLKSGVPFTNRGYPSYFPFDVLSGWYFNVRRLVKEIHKFNPDIVHSHGTEGPYALSGIKCKCPCIISIQGIISELFKVSPALTFCIVGYLEQLEVRKGRYFACRTQFDTNFVLSHNKQARIFALDEAMGPIFFECDWKLSDSQKILFVGSLIRRKGVKTVLEALALVMNEFPRVSLYLIGDGERNYIEYLRNLSKKLGIQKNVEFLGFKSGMEIAKFYVESQLFVFPSENDNSPNSVAEAMVSGMPVIATRVGGIPSMIEDGQTGLLVEPNNPQELAEKIIHLLSKPNERKRLGDNAKNVARSRHLPDKVAENTIETYRHILDLEGRKYISAK